MSILAGLLTHKCDVYRANLVSQGDGAWESTGQNLVKAGVACVINRNGENRSQAPGGEVNRSSHRGYFEWVAEPDLRPGDIVKNVRPAANEGDPDQETSDLAEGAETAGPQYKVLDRFDPNGLREHLEVGLEHFRGMVQP